MELTSFILGVCAVIVLLMVVGMFMNNMKIKSLKADLENFKMNQLYEAGIMRTKVNDNERETYDSISELQRNVDLDRDKLYRHIDSRVDKTVDNISQGLADIYRTIDQLDQNNKNELVKDTKSLLTD